MAMSFVVSLMLTALPMPEWASLWRPAWVALVLIYWCMALPARSGVLVGWSVGLLLDVMTGTLLGQHALALARRSRDQASSATSATGAGNSSTAGSHQSSPGSKASPS